MPERTVIPANPRLIEAIGGRGTWSEAVGVGDIVWVTGQLGWDKTTGQLAGGIEAQTELALRNLQEVLERAGSDLANVVLTRIYLTDHNDYERYDAVYQRFFPQRPPARVSIVVADIIHHALIDIEAVAVKRL